MAKFILYLFTCIVWQISIVSAGDLEQGIRFFEKKDYAQAKELWQPLAKNGDARAQYNLALLLYKEILSDAEGGTNIQKNLQRHKAGKYLAMSRSEGLIDGYFVTIPVSEAMAVVFDDPVSWLRKQQKSNYTLQLVTGNSQKSMQKIHQKLLSSQLLEQPHNLYIQKVEKNKQEKIVIQYVLIYGIFKTYQEAKDEAEKLPESIQKSKPWIRQIGVIQSMVNVKKNEET